jgi:hypothetical protein
MANMRHVNQYIKTNFPDLKVEAVRGEGYVYFDGEDGFDKIESIYVNPVSISTDVLVGIIMETLDEYQRNL